MKLRKNTDTNTELRALSLGNFLSGIVGALPVTLEADMSQMRNQLLQNVRFKLSYQTMSRIIAGSLIGCYLVVVFVMSPTAIVSLVPMPIIAASLLQQATEYLHECIFRTFNELSVLEYTTVVCPPCHCLLCCCAIFSLLPY